MFTDREMQLLSWILTDEYVRGHTAKESAARLVAADMFTPVEVTTFMAQYGERLPGLFKTFIQDPIDALKGKRKAEKKEGRKHRKE